MLASHPFAVAYLLSFGGDAHAPGGRSLVMGDGSAGWTVASFERAADALAFARAIPESSRVRAHARTIAKLEKAAAAA